MLERFRQPCPRSVDTEQKIDAGIATIMRGSEQRGFIAVLKPTLERHVCAVV